MFHYLIDANFIIFIIAFAIIWSILSIVTELIRKYLKGRIPIIINDAFRLDHELRNKVKHPTITSIELHDRFLLNNDKTIVEVVRIELGLVYHDLPSVFTCRILNDDSLRNFLPMYNMKDLTMIRIDYSKDTNFDIKLKLTPLKDKLSII